MVNSIAGNPVLQTDPGISLLFIRENRKAFFLKNCD